MEDTQGQHLIAIIGATGRTGIPTVKKLIEWQDKEGWKIRILARDVEKARQLLPFPSLEFVKADITDKESLKLGIEEAEYVISCIGGFSLFGTSYYDIL